MLSELVPNDEAARAHLQPRQSCTALALRHEAIAARLREQYHRLHHSDLADLVRRDQGVGVIAAGRDPVAAATTAAALAEGLAHHVLIGATDPEQARREVLAAVAVLDEESWPAAPLQRDEAAGREVAGQGVSGLSAGSRGCRPGRRGAPGWRGSCR